ncbi:glycosyltransferase family 4 protein [Methylobacterium sp. E-005]|uniref:glycosyltransferase family 4 protein n=1 Tax=Methylobacterium sp. E-005 TaxID=2836549 RepID=UPI001FBA50AB|nr:glycosyltransferase family 4 protein [Methylobacterium sp. E-005]MCJ2087748.1 glycosyltransferase family 4 protein [Methylobacterium sp. E-005]
MRILHLSSLYPPEQVGGAELMVETLARTQADQGHAVAVACAARDEAGPAQQDGVTVYRTGYGTPFHILDWPQHGRLDRLRYKLATQWNPKTVARMAASVRDFAPDVVNTHSLSELPPALWPMLARHGVPVVHTLHDFTSLCTNGAMARNGKACTGQHLKCRLYAEPHRRCQRAVSAVAAVGTDLLDRHLAAGFFGAVPSALRRVIWNPIPTGAPITRRKRTPHEPVRFGFLGRIETSKGADILFAACRALPSHGWSLAVAGRAVDGLDRYRAATEGLPVTFPGFVARDAFLDGIDCLVVPPIWPEPFGRTVAEAYARGVPVIGTAIGGIGEQIGPGPWLVPPGDEAALAGAMARIVAEPGRLAEGLARAQAIRAGTDPAAVADAYLDLYAATRQARASSTRNAHASPLWEGVGDRGHAEGTGSIHSEPPPPPPLTPPHTGEGTRESGSPAQAERPQLSECRP